MAMPCGLGSQTAGARRTTLGAGFGDCSGIPFFQPRSHRVEHGLHHFDASCLSSLMGGFGACVLVEVGEGVPLEDGMVGGQSPPHGVVSWNWTSRRDAA